jgi:putative addiction module killer protein
MALIEVLQYRAPDGTLPFDDWLLRLRDGQARARIAARIDRMQVGLRGDWKSVGAGVCELRVDCGPGYRIYFAQDGAALVLLLCGGDKRSQQRDIEVAHGYWQDYRARTHERSVPRKRLPAR